MTATYTISELVAASGYPARTIRQYIQNRVLARPPNHGKSTLYGESYVAALRAIRKLRDERQASRYEDLRAWFAGKSLAQIESFVTGVPVAPAPPPAPPKVNVPAPAIPGERWVHVPLVPGMVLLVRDGAPDVVTRLAAEIRAKYASG
jgi:hypothetical protein